MPENVLLQSPIESLADLQRLKSRLGALVFVGGLLLCAALGAAIGWSCVPDTYAPVFGAFIGAFVGLMPLFVLMALIEQVFNWMYHMLAIQNKLLVIAMQREASTRTKYPLSGDSL